MNRIVLVGKLSQRPVLRHTAGGLPVADASLVTSRIHDQGDQQTTVEHRLMMCGDAAKLFAVLVGLDMVGLEDLIEVRGQLEYTLREIAGETVKEAVVWVQEWTRIAPSEANEPAEETEPAATADGGEDGHGCQSEGDIHPLHFGRA